MTYIVRTVRVVVVGWLAHLHPSKPTNTRYGYHRNSFFETRRAAVTSRVETRSIDGRREFSDPSVRGRANRKLRRVERIGSKERADKSIRKRRPCRTANAKEQDKQQHNNRVKNTECLKV